MQPSSESESIQRQQQALVDSQIASSERELECVQARILQLKSTRNDLAAVSKLPTEVLCCIFQHLRKAKPRIPEVLHQLHWTRVTHVCRRWRQSAVAFSKLWSHGHITDDVVVWMANMLEWSKPCPISLHLRNSNLSDQEERVVLQAFAEVERLESVVIEGPNPICQRKLSYLQARAPKLRSLSVHGRAAISVESICIDLSWLLHGAPSLHALVLRDCKVHCPSSSLSSNLAELSINTNMHDLATAQSFLTGIRNLPALRFLCIFDIDFPPLPEPQGIWLPDLAKFSAMDDNRESLYNFMQHLHVPSTCALNIPSMHKMARSINLINHLWVPTLTSLWSMDRQRPTLRFLSLSGPFDGKSKSPINYRFWGEDANNTDEPPSPTVEWDLCSTLAPALFTLSTPFNSIAVLKITEVSFNGETLALMGEAMPSLHQLCLEDCDPREILTVLDATPSTSSGRSANLCFPSLTTLIFESIYVTTVTPSDNGVSERILDLGLLLRVLKGRALSGCRMHTMGIFTFSTWNTPICRELQRLRAWTKKVVWQETAYP